jgi:hypothetical protein
MSEMVERVAKAIMTANEQSTGLKFSDLCRDMARAAIEEMREPVPGMRSAGADVAGNSEDGAAIIWRAMIDEALK